MKGLKRLCCGLCAAAGLLAVRCGAPEDSGTAPEPTAAVTESTAAAGTEHTAAAETDTQQRTSGAGRETDDASVTTAASGETAPAQSTAAQKTGTASGSGTKSAPESGTQADTVKTNDDGLIEFPFIEIR